jgi:Tfp pilus assembly protein PilP
VNVSKVAIVFGLVVSTGGVAAARSNEQTPLRIGTRVGVGEVSGYDSGGRRDPFASLIVERPAAAPAPARRAAGLAGLSMADVTIKGIITNGQTWIAIVAGPDGVSYMARPNDRLHDAVVRRIDREAVIFAAQVTDVTGATLTREVRKELRPKSGDVR